MRCSSGTPAVRTSTRTASTPPSTSRGSFGFERRHNSALQFDAEDGFVQALLRDIPPAPEQQAAIIAANRSGRPLVASG